jgi:hypothetical protein
LTGSYSGIGDRPARAVRQQGYQPEQEEKMLSTLVTQLISALGSFVSGLGPLLGGLL